MAKWDCEDFISSAWAKVENKNIAINGRTINAMLGIVVVSFVFEERERGE